MAAITFVKKWLKMVTTIGLIFFQKWCQIPKNVQVNFIAYLLHDSDEDMGSPDISRILKHDIYLYP